VVGRPNLEVQDCAFVERIAFEGSRAVGVEVVRNGTRETLRAEREVILADGAYQSPVRLMLSGIGLAKELSGGWRLLPHPPGAAGARRRIPLLGRAALHDPRQDAAPCCTNRGVAAEFL